MFRGLSHAAGLRLFFLGREMRPKERDTIGAISALEGSLEGLRIVDVRCDDLGPETSQVLRVLPVRVPRDRAGDELAGRVIVNGANETATLGSGGTYNRDDSLAALDS